MSSSVHFECRTSRVTVAMFQTANQAQDWLDRQDPAYGQTLRLVKVTTMVVTEVLQEAA